MTGLVRFAKEQLGLELWPGQREVLEGLASTAGGARDGRRSGKTLLGACAWAAGLAAAEEPSPDP